MGLKGLMKTQPYRHRLCPRRFLRFSRTALELPLGFAKEAGVRLTVVDAAWHNP